MKIVSWNINGLNSILSKTKAGTKDNCNKHISNNVLVHLIKEHDPDIICLQEVRCSNAIILLEKYFKDTYPYIYLNCAAKAGYSGTAILSKVKPIDVQYNFHHHSFNSEGRLITMIFEDWVLINTYSPNSKQKLERLNERIEVWEPALRSLIQHHSTKKDIVLCGDLNVAHEDIDIHSPYTNRNNAGFTDRERLSFGLLLHNTNMIDAFRYMYPTTIKYSWWSNFHQSRSKNKGWRIDYFLISKQLQKELVDCNILTDFYGSDHAPVALDLTFSPP
jgi:exodeoxyribonuclease-3